MKYKTRYMTIEAAERARQDGDYIHALPGIARADDYYVIAKPEQVIIKKIPQTYSKKMTDFWHTCHLIVGDTCVLYASIYRVKSFLRSKRKLNLEAIEYLQRDRTPHEFWKNKTNDRMEAARISHVLCDEPGKAGHDARQKIRKKILAG